MVLGGIKKGGRTAIVAKDAHGGSVPRGNCMADKRQHSQSMTLHTGIRFKVVGCEAKGLDETDGILITFQALRLR